MFDFVFYGAIPMAFIMADPGQNAVAGAVLLLSFYINGASFLAYGLIAEKRGFHPGGELQDWVEAEKQVDNFLQSQA